METLIYMQRITHAINCNSSVFGKTIGDYIKLYEDMHLNSQVYDDFNVAYLISEASS